MATVFPQIAEGWEPNEEGAPIKEPVPYEKLGYTDQSRPEDLKVVFVHRWYSPPSAIVRAVLNYYQVQQERLIMDVPFKKSISKVAYKKVPMVIFMPSEGTGSGYQVNDTLHILKALYPMLTGGKDIADDLSEEDQKKFCIKMLCSMLVALNITHGYSASLARHFMNDDNRSNPILKVAAHEIVKQNNHGFQKKGYAVPFPEILTWFVESIQTRKEGAVFFGGDEPSPMDVFAYGTVCFALVVTEDKVNKGTMAEGDSCWVHEDLKAAGAMDWFQAMDKAYKERAKEAMFPEEVKDAAPKSLWGFS